MLSPSPAAPPTISPLLNSRPPLIDAKTGRGAVILLPPPTPRASPPRPTGTSAPRLIAARKGGGHAAPGTASCPQSLDNPAGCPHAHRRYCFWIGRRKTRTTRNRAPLSSSRARTTLKNVPILR